MALRRTVLQELLLGALILAALEAKQINSSCNRRCGSLSIPYPFGTSEDCYLDPHFLITCNHTFNPPKPFPGDGNVEVLHISLDGELLVDNYVAGSCVNGSSNNPGFTSGWTRISYKKNKFITVGCDTVAFIEGNTTKKNYTTGCISRCDSINSVVNGSCNGIGCCESLIPEDITYFNISVIRLYNDSKTESFNPCGFGFLVEKGAYKFSSLDLANLQNRETLPVVLDWAVGDETCSEAQKNKTSYACKATYSGCYNSTNGPGYRCRCSSGYEGNPYLPNGCKDVDECKASNPCSSEKQCINVYGTFKCVCQKGYKEYKVKNETMCSPKDNNYGSIAIGLEDHLFDILDNHIMNEDNVEELQKVANLVQRCLSVRGEDRPSMREVAMELEGLRIVKAHARGKTTLSMGKTRSSLTEPAEFISMDVGADCSFTNESVTYDTTRSHELKAFDDGR